MRLVMLGPPGAGKGTQAVILAHKYNIPNISTGDIFRHNIKELTPLGIKAKEFIDKGLLVPDELTVDIVEDRVMHDDCKNGFLLDGFPRTLFQADALDKFLDAHNLNLDAVINIQVDDEEIIKRISGRRTCRHCKGIFSTNDAALKDRSDCPKCGGELYQRDDDRQEVVSERLITYNRQTKPLIDYYREKGNIIDINGMDSIENVAQNIIDALGSE